MKANFEFINNIQCSLKAALAEVAAFKSGEKYKRIQEGHQKEIRHFEHENQQ